MPFPNSRLLHPRFHESIRRSAVADLGMPDTCRIVRPVAGDGADGLNPATGLWSPPAWTDVFEGCCRVQPVSRRIGGNTVDPGDEPLTLHQYRASIPWDADQVLVDDVLTVTCTHDPQLAGRPLVIRDVKYDTFQVRRFLDLEDHPNLATPEVT